MILELFMLYIFVLLSVALLGQAYAISRLGIENIEFQKKLGLAAFGWPVLALAGATYFLALGVIYSVEGSFESALRRLEGRLLNRTTHKP